MIRMPPPPTQQAEVAVGLLDAVADAALRGREQQDGGRVDRDVHGRGEQGDGADGGHHQRQVFDGVERDEGEDGDDQQRLQHQQPAAVVAESPPAVAVD
jgi:hypothetical protein